MAAPPETTMVPLAFDAAPLLTTTVPEMFAWVAKEAPGGCPQSCCSIVPEAEVPMAPLPSRDCEPPRHSRAPRWRVVRWRQKRHSIVSVTSFGVLWNSCCAPPVKVVGGKRRKSGRG